VAADADCVVDGSVRNGAIFNQPHWESNGGDDKIHRHIVCLIDGAAGGSEIRVASYHFAHKDIKDALLSAHERGVDVKVMLDRGVIADDDDGPIYTELMDKIGTDGEDSWVRRCAGADLGPGPDPDPGDDRACIGNVKMHNKLLLFSETHGAANVSFITSSNLEDNDAASNSGTDMWNSGYTATAPDLYDHLYRYFDDMSGFTDNGWEDPADPNYYQTANLPQNYGIYTVFHSPREEGNTALDILSKVRCHGNTSGGTDPGNRTIVRVASWNISGDEDSDPGTKIARKLWELDNQGCYVDIVADRISDDQNGPLRTLLAKPETMDGTPTNYHGPEVREFNSGQPHGVHQKNLLIDGHYDGKPNQKVVFTGSYNFTYRSVRVNDETWLQINDPNAHASFLRNFLDVRNAAHTCWQTSRTEGCDGGRVIQPDPTAPLNCHETADKYLGADNLYLYSANNCDGPNDAKDNSGADSDYGDNEGQIQNYDNKASSIVNTTDKHIKFYNYPNYNFGHPEGDSFCVRPGHWVNRLELHGDNQGNWQTSISSHRLVDDPNDCDRWFGGYHEPHRPRTN
jgi:hypothetical protein